MMDGHIQFRTWEQKTRIRISKAQKCNDLKMTQ